MLPDRTFLAPRRKERQVQKNRSKVEERGFAASLPVKSSFASFLIFVDESFAERLGTPSNMRTSGHLQQPLDVAGHDEPEVFDLQL
jgi:hypothetical protein